MQLCNRHSFQDTRQTQQWEVPWHLSCQSYSTLSATFGFVRDFCLGIKPTAPHWQASTLPLSKSSSSYYQFLILVIPVAVQWHFSVLVICISLIHLMKYPLKVSLNHLPHLPPRNPHKMLGRCGSPSVIPALEGVRYHQLAMFSCFKNLLSC